MVKCNYQHVGRWFKKDRDSYNDGPRGITPVIQVPGGGMLWLGTMRKAKDGELMIENGITVR